MERYVISGDARVALQQVITSAMQNTGSLSTGERQDVVSEPAKGKFVRDQTLGAAFFWIQRRSGEPEHRSGTGTWAIMTQI